MLGKRSDHTYSMISGTSNAAAMRYPITLTPPRAKLSTTSTNVDSECQTKVLIIAPDKKHDSLAEILEKDSPDR